VPIAHSAVLSARRVRTARLEIDPGGSHGMCSTGKDRVNAELPGFIRG